MLHVEVLGFDCSACRKTRQQIADTAQAMGVAVQLEKVDDPVRIAAYNVHTVPAVAVNHVLRYSGGVPDRKTIETWLLEG